MTKLPNTSRIAVLYEPTIEDALLAQRLMLYNWPGVQTIGDLLLYALRKLAETTDD